MLKKYRFKSFTTVKALSFCILFFYVVFGTYHAGANGGFEKTYSDGVFYAELADSSDGFKSLRALARMTSALTAEGDSYDFYTPRFSVNLNGVDVYNLNESAALLTVNAVVDSGSPVYYQWYYSLSSAKTDAVLVEGASDNSYLPPTNTTYLRYYFVEASAVKSENGVTVPVKVQSNAKAVIVNTKINAVSPSITKDISGSYDYGVGVNAQPLSISAETSSGTLSYQWYKNGQPISGAVSGSYTPVTSEVGISYYSVVVTNYDQTATGEKYNSKSSGYAMVKVGSAAAANAPVFTKNLSGFYNYSPGEVPSSLTVEASATDGGYISYQWYAVKGGVISKIAGATGNTYMPDTSTAGNFVYYVVAINNKVVGGIVSTADTTSGIVRVNVSNSVDAQIPVYTTNVTGESIYKVGSQPADLYVDASVTDGGTLSYQWYENSTESTDGAAAIPGATFRAYTPSTAYAGVKYYYVVVTNTNNLSSLTGNKSVSVVVRYKKITVTDAVDAQAPSVSSNVSGSSVYTLGAASEKLYSIATVDDGGTLTYQWFVNDVASRVGETHVAGANTPEFYPPTDKIGTWYYSCEVTNTNMTVTGNKVTKTFVGYRQVVVNSDMNAAVPSYTSHNITGEAYYSELQVADTLKAEGVSSTDGGAITYQWYYNSSASEVGATAVIGATSSSYTPPTDVLSTRYYYLKITNTNSAAAGNKSSSIILGYKKITVSENVNAQAPVFTKNLPENIAYSQNSTNQPLEVYATVTDGGTISYQWYYMPDGTQGSSIPISQQNGNVYTVPTVNTGVFYYYVVATNTNNSLSGLKSAETKSNVIKVTVSSGSSTGTYKMTSSVATTGGSISPSGDTYVNYGGSVTYEITPKRNYYILKVEVDGRSVGGVSSYTFEDVSGNHVITAHFRARTGGSSGTVSVSTPSPTATASPSPTSSPVGTPAPTTNPGSGIPYYVQNGRTIFIGQSHMVNGQMKYVAPKGVSVMFKDNKKYFPDVAGNWAEEYIDFVTEREIFLGVWPDAFVTNSPMTRGMMVTVLGRMYEASYGSAVLTKPNPFIDVSSDSWYSHYVRWAYESGITQGIYSDTFMPDSPITREQFVMFIVRYMKALGVPLSGESTSLPFSDSNLFSAWAVESVKFAYSLNLISGYTGNLFVPQGILTRAEACALIKRSIETSMSLL